MSLRRSDDAQLLRDLTRALNAGDTDGVNRAFEAIYHAYARSVAFVCARYVTDDADVQSLTDDVLLSFFKRVVYLDSVDSLRAYLMQSARHAAMDFCRAKNRRERGLTELPEHSDGEMSDDPLALIPDPEGDVTAHARYQALVEDLCATLGREPAAIILAHAVCGESFPEIAARMGKKENTVKTLYHRAIRKFRKERGDCWL